MSGTRQALLYLKTLRSYKLILEKNPKFSDDSINTSYKWILHDQARAHLRPAHSCRAELFGVNSFNCFSRLFRTVESTDPLRKDMLIIDINMCVRCFTFKLCPGWIGRKGPWGDSCTGKGTINRRTTQRCCHKIYSVRNGRQSEFLELFQRKLQMRILSIKAT